MKPKGTSNNGTQVDIPVLTRYCDRCHVFLEANQDFIHPGRGLGPVDYRLMQKQTVQEASFCKKCFQRTTAVEDYYFHNCFVHGYIMSYRCGVCNRSTLTEAQMQGHLIEEHPKKKFRL